MPLRTIGNWLVGRRDLSAQARRYAQTVLWLYRAVFRFRPWSTAIAIGANVGGTLLKGASLTLLVYFASMLESDTPLILERLGIILQPREPGGFAFMVVLIGVLLLAGGIVVFLANRMNIRLAVEFALDRSREVLTLSAGRPSRNIDPVAGPYPKEIDTRAKGVIVIARSIRPLLQLFQPLLLLLICLAALLYIAPFLTALLVLLALPSLLFQYLINYTAAQNQKLMGKAQRKMQKGVTALLDSLALAPKVSKSEADVLTAAYTGEEIREYPERFVIRVMAQPKSQAVSDMLITVLAMIIVIYLGISALTGQISWALVVGYVVFARVGMTSLRGLLGTITGFARHYPRARKTYELLTSGPQESVFDQDKFRIRRSDLDSPGDLKRIELQRGDILGVLSPVPFTRYNSYAWADALSAFKNTDRKKLWGAMICIPDARNKHPGGSLRELLILDPGLAAEEVQKALAGLVSGADFDPADIDVDAPLDEQAWKTLPGSLRCHLLLEQGVRSGKDILLIERQILARAEAEYLKKWWTAAEAAGRFVLVRHNKPATLGSFGEKAVLAMRTDRARAIMSPEWAKLNFDALSAWFAAARVTEAEEEEEDLME